MKHRGTLLAAFLFLTVLGITLAPCAWAQLYTGSVSGIVTDPTSAVIPGAKVTIQDVATQVPQSVTTDAGGRYLFRSLAPATYRLTIEMRGFSMYVQDKIVLEVSQNLAINAALQLGSETQKVEVAAEVAALSTQDATTGQELNRTFINELPLLGRGVFDLATLAPGVHAREGNSGGGINFISNGSRNSTSDILMDGVSATSYEQNSGILDPLYTPSVDSVQEFKISQSNFSAEIGFSGSTVINMVTRSGSNQYHGSGWEFLRNNHLRANDWFSNENGGTLAARHYNQFGTTFGGPIKKDKTFFFFSYEGTRDVNAGTYHSGVPSQAMRTGNFGELCAEGFDSAGKCTGEGQLWDPYSGHSDPESGGTVRTDYIPYNRVDLYQSPGNPALNGTQYQPAAKPGNLIDPVAAKIMTYFPLPNSGVGTSGYNIYNNWIGSDSSHSRNDQWDLKIDHSFNENNRLSAKFSRALSSSTPATPFGNALDPVGNMGSSHTHMFAVNFNHTFSPTTLLNFSAGYTRRFDDYKDQNFDLTTLGLPAYLNTSGFNTSPNIDLDRYYKAGNGNIGAQPWGILRQSPETYHLVGGISRLSGRHDLRVGGEMRMHRISFTQPGEEAGYFNFGQDGTSQSPGVGGDPMASFLMGVTAWGEYEMPVFDSTQNFQIAGYLQDNFKVNERLTLNLGIRYDLETPRTERYNRMSYVDPGAASPLQVPGLPNLKGVLAFAENNNRHNWGYDSNNFGPRFGFAYKLTNNTVMRGGYGIFYQITTRGAAGSGAYGFQGFDRYTEMINTYQGPGPAHGSIPQSRLADPFPAGILLPPGSSLGGLSYVGEGIRGPIKGMDATPYEQAWTFGFQHQLSSFLFDLSYVGKRGTKLFFGGASELNHLGPQIESYSADQIAGLVTNVTNPLQAYVPVTAPLGGSEVQAYQLQLPYPQFTSVQGISFPVANSIYHALQFKVEKRFSSGFQFLSTYSFSKSIDDASVTHDGITWLGGTTSLQDPNNYALERSLSQFDVTHLLNIGYVYELPFGHRRAFGKTWNPVLNAILGGWNTNGIWHFSSGFPIGLALAEGIALPTYGTQRPNLTAALKRNTGADFRDNYFANPEVVVTPEHYAIGNAPRTIGSARTPGSNNANLSLLKQFSMDRIREAMHFEFRAEFFNAFNHPRFAGPDTTLNGGSFGQVSSMANDAREIQLALKFYW
jgi:hypothetical protein